MIIYLFNSEYNIGEFIIILLNLLILFFNSFNCIDTLNTQISNDLIKLWFRNLTNFFFFVNEDNPDFLIYDVVGNENLNPKYNNSIKIAYYTQNAIPDLNQADFALGQAHIMYLDRYLKFPYFLFILDKVDKYDFVKINTG